jgi:sigma-E factor negative regulatory protein RseC
VAGFTERGVVIAVAGDRAEVRVASGAACENCKGDCCRVDTEGLVVEGALNDVGARVGDEVTVEVPEGADVRAGVIVYIVPVVGLLLGYLAGNLLAGALGWNRDALGAVGAVAVVSAGLLWLRSAGRSALSSARYRPTVRAIIAPGLSPSPSTGRIENDPRERV